MREFSLRSVLVALLLALLPLVGRPAAAQPNLLVDAENGRVLYAEDADRPWHPASTTKLMTAYVVFQALRDGKLKLDDQVIQSERSIGEAPSKLGMPVGQGLAVDLALQALIVKSANDVAVMLAEKVGGSVEGFVELMNATAKKLGMTATRYVNPNGLHNEGQITSARDLARLALALLRDFPEHKDRFSRIYVTIGKRQLHSYNSLLRTYQGADGMKTGFVCASGYNVVASATRNGHKLIAVVLGARSGGDRAIRAAGMFDFGFEYYDWQKLLAANNLSPELAGMPLGPESSAAPADMRNLVCGARAYASRSVKKKAARRKVRHPLRGRPRHH
jgi:D-alanyl-D-alanine carboxypeptidase